MDISVNFFPGLGKDLNPWLKSRLRILSFSIPEKKGGISVIWFPDKSTFSTDGSFSIQLGIETNSFLEPDVYKMMQSMAP